MKMADAIELYINLRDQRDARKAEHSAELKEKFTNKMDKIEVMFLKHFEKVGLDSTKATGIGTAYISRRVTDKVVNKEALIEHCKSTGNFDMFVGKVSKASVDEYVEETGDMPAGVVRTTDLKVNIRRG